MTQDVDCDDKPLLKDDKEVWTHDWAIAPQSIEELWAYIGAAAFRFGQKNRIVWRGLGKSSHDVSSTLVRELRSNQITLSEEAIRRRESEILRMARKWDIGLSEHGTASDLHLLAMLQHHGVPTRLIDVTYNPMTALWFACSQEPDESGVLVAMNVTAAHRHTTSERGTLDYEAIDSPESASLVSLLQESRTSRQPFILEPRPQDARMKAQEGIFIGSSWIDDNNKQPMLGLPLEPVSGFFTKVLQMMGSSQGIYVEDDKWTTFGAAGLLISPEMKSKLVPILDHTFNRSHRTMYPDLAGFSSAYRTGTGLPT